jgi:hypothetical protein
MDPDGAPTPVAWTRMRAPQSLMAPTPDEVLKPGIAASSLTAKYGQAIDRDSAHEILARRLQAGAEEAAREQQAKDAAAQQAAAAKDQAAQAKEQARVQAQAERDARAAQSPQRRTAPAARHEKSMVEQIAGSSVFKQFARTASSEIVRSIFGTARRRR